MHMKKSLLFIFAAIGFVLATQAQTNKNFEKAVAMELVAANLQQIGLPVEELKNAEVSSAYYTESSGSTMVYLQQTYKGIPVFNKMLVLAFKNGQLISKAGYFIDKMDELTSSASATPLLSVSRAVQFAFAEQKVKTAVTGNPIIAANGKIYDFGKLAGGSENTTAELMWFPVEKEKLERVKLVWQVQVSPPKVDDVWQVRVDAATGKIISKYNILVTEQFGKQQAFTYVTERQDKTPGVINTKYNPGFTKTESPSLVSTANYMVIPYPLEAPSFGTAAMRTNPWANAAGNASSLGWHNDGTVDYTISRGNNVWATEDTIATNQNLGLPATSSTSPDPLNFITPPNYNVEPSRNPAMQQFCITNLFYWNNVIHDLSYLYGFDEVSGNFQANNQGRGGNGNDHVMALAQSGAAGHIGNNANFLTPVDGGRGRMRMYLFNEISTTNLLVNTPVVIGGSYTAIESGFSTANKLGNVGPVTGQVVYYNDDATGATHFACGTPVPAGSVAGKIALIDRGFGGATCTATVPFTTKVLNAQNAGAIAVIMVNNVAGDPIVMGGTDNTITIPAVMISQSDGSIFAAQLANNVNVTLSGTVPQPRDGDLDNGIISHEFGHGISNRFTGGPGNSSCLQNAEQGGEGWGDYMGLMFTTNWATATMGDGAIGRGVGTYVVGQLPTGAGIRNFKYSTNIVLNPLTYANMGTGTIGTEVHNIGEIWCVALWEMTWGIIQQENSINPNLYNFSLGNTGGNSIALKLVMEGMRLQPCSPGYIDARNAILTADRNLYGGRHQCAIWTAFAKRGMGYSASQGSSFSATDQTAATDLPPAPTVTGQPTDVTVLAGANATFTVTATPPINGAFIYYNWQVSTNGGASWADVSPAVTTSSITLNAVTLAMNGNKYRCILTQGCATTTSGVATLTVSTPSGFTFTTPAPATTTCPAPATMAITLNTTSVGGFTTPINLSATAGVPGGTNVTYSVNPVTPGNSTVVTLNNTNTLTAGTYVITITGIAGASNQTVNLTYTINAGTGPTITGQPTTQTVCAGSNASFSITSAAATGFQWQVSTDGGGTWTNVSGATAPTLTLTAVTAGMNNNQYRCIASTLCGTTNSNGAILTVNSPAAITAQPQNTSACSGSNATFTVTATGTGLTYQWELSTDGGANYNAIGGATSASFTATAVTVGMNNNRYRCVVTSSGVCVPAFVTSTGAILTVVSSLSITSQPADVTVCEGATINFTVAASGATITYQWQLSTDGGATFNNIGGATAATFTITGVTAAQNGHKFRCQVTSPCGNATSNIVTLTVNTLPAITAQPQNVNLCAGSNNTFSVTATGTAITYQWQLSTNGCAGPWNNIGGATSSSFTLTSITVGQNNTGYRCVVSGTCAPAATSNCALLTVVSSVTITTQPANQIVCEGSGASFTAAASGAGLTYQWQLSTNSGGTWTNIGGATNATYSTGATTFAMNGNQYRCIISNGVCPTPGTTNAATLTVNTLPIVTTNPQSAAICVGGNNTFSVTATGTGITYQWQLSTDGGATYNSIGGATASGFTVSSATLVMNNNRYRCVVSGTCTPAATSATATLTVNAAVTVSSNPANAELCSGSNATFNVAGVSVPAIIYQWQVSTDGGTAYNNIAGANSSSLIVNSVTTAMNNNRYRCLLSNATCTVAATSGAAILIVRQNPTVGLTQSPVLATLLPGQTTTLTATATSGTGGTFSNVWTYNSSPLTVSGNSYVVDIEHTGAYQVRLQETWPSTLVCSANSQVITITAGVSSNLFVFPSPNNGNFSVSYYNNGGAATQRTLAIFDSKGSMVFNKAFNISGPYTLLPVNLQRASTGIYYVVIGDATGKKLAEGKVHVR
jgi:extracellular elastinolytic metalloproteinase